MQVGHLLHHRAQQRHHGIHRAREAGPARARSRRAEQDHLEDERAHCLRTARPRPRTRATSTISVLEMPRSANRAVSLAASRSSATLGEGLGVGVGDRQRGGGAAPRVARSRCRCARRPRASCSAPRRRPRARPGGTAAARRSWPAALLEVDPAAVHDVEELHPAGAGVVVLEAVEQPFRLPAHRIAHSRVIVPAARAVAPGWQDARVDAGTTRLERRRASRRDPGDRRGGLRGAALPRGLPQRDRPGGRISKALIYEHFASKRALHASLLERTWGRSSNTMI